MSSATAMSMPTKLPAWSPGPVTLRRVRMTEMTYAAIAVLGLLPFLAGGAPWLQAAGAGLWFPGGGFLADGGWAVLLFPPTVVLFLAALFAWFGAGMVVAPIFVWFGSALLAGGLAGTHIWLPGAPLSALAAFGTGFTLIRRERQRVARDIISATERAAILPVAMAQVAARAAPKPARDARELTDDELGGARYMLDRALQKLDGFEGFDRIDIFQTASVRYQINMMGYGLSQLQRHYTPNFHGYMSQAQRNLIEKYLDRRVWNYWVYESVWGHFNVSDWNPAAKDNIMLTGYYGAQVSLYMGNTGDMRYAEPGSLTFRLNRRQAWAHDIHSITRSVYDNSKASAFCLYPCEPNWIYAGCNFRGMTTLAAHDQVFGTNFIGEIRDRWLQQLDTEFTTASGGIVGLRSTLTGIEFPFPSSDLGYCTTANSFAPERASRMWAMVQAGLRKALAEKDGKPVLMIPDSGIDFGNYRRGALTFAMGAAMFAAHEFGDEELAQAAANTLDLRCGRMEQDGVLHYRNGSNLANIAAAAGRFMRRNDFRDMFVTGPSASALSGPLLDQVSYPDVLVARAFSNGEDLDLVLLPGRGAGPQRIGLSRLVPGRSYTIADRPGSGIVADPDGRATFPVTLERRTRVHIVPA